VGSLCRTESREVTYLGVLPTDTVRSDVKRAERELGRLARDEARNSGSAVVVQRDDVVAEVVERAAQCDLMILGLSHTDRRRRVFGQRTAEIARATDCPLLMISQRG